MLQRRWTPEDRGLKRLLDAALILCADHELPVSTFAVRCVASSGATPYAAVNAGLCALQGVKHGGQIELVEKLLEEVGETGDARGSYSRTLETRGRAYRVSATSSTPTETRGAPS